MERSGDPGAGTTRHDVLRDYRPEDAAELGRVAVAAFAPFAPRYADWPAMEATLAAMPRLAEAGELIVAERSGRLAGGVAYVPAGKPKAAYFDPDWATIRMLVVHPEARGRGLGRILAEECLRRARRDGARAVALHTSPIMEVALPMYLRMGFRLLRDAPPIHGVPYGVYLRPLDD